MEFNNPRYMKHFKIRFEMHGKCHTQALGAGIFYKTHFLVDVDA